MWVERFEIESGEVIAYWKGQDVPVDGTYLTFDELTAEQKEQAVQILLA